MRLSLFCFVSALVAFPVSSQASSLASGLAYDQSGSQIILISDKEQIAKGAENFIDTMGKRAIGFLSNASLSKSQKEKQFRNLLTDSFDLKSIGRFSLGTYWRTSNDAQKAEYQDLFEDLVVNVYAQRFDEYQGQQLKIVKSRPEGKRDVIVNSVIVDQSGTEFKVDWRVRYKDNKYKIIDVIIEGVSMALTQRSDFSSVIQRGGGNVNALITHLKSNK